MKPTQEFLYSFRATLIKKQFKSQHSSETIKEMTFAGDEVKDVKESIWNEVASSINRRVLFEDNQPKWDTKETPEYRDIDLYVSITHKNARKSSLVSSLDSKSLQALRREQEIFIVIYEFGTAVDSKRKYEILQQQLITPAQVDRAHSENTVATVELVQRLKEQHKESYRSQYVNWMMWATYIQKKSPLERESLIKQNPPANMIHLFQPVPCNFARINEGTRQNIRLAQNISNGSERNLKEMRIFYDKARILLTELIETMDDFGVRLIAMESAVEANREMLEDLETVTSPVENSFSQDIASQVGDQMDIDHS